MEGAVTQRAGRVRQVAAKTPALIRECLDHGMESLLLQLGGRIVLDIGTGQMAVQPHEPKVRHRADLLNQSGARAPIRPEATHAGVHFQLHRKGGAALFRADLIAEARIEYTGAGVISDKQGPGIGTRIIDNIWPF